MFYHGILVHIEAKAAGLLLNAKAYQAHLDSPCQHIFRLNRVHNSRILCLHTGQLDLRGMLVGGDRFPIGLRKGHFIVQIFTWMRYLKFVHG